MIRTLVGQALAMVPVLAQGAEPVCPATPAALPAALAGWSPRTPVTSGAKAPAPLAIGRGADVALLPMASVAFPVRPGKPGEPGSHGGLIGFTVATAGPYRVAIGSGAWIDVIRAGTPVASTGHGHGPVCSGVRKMVDFALTPGDHILQIAGSASVRLPVLIVKRP